MDRPLRSFIIKLSGAFNSDRGRESKENKVNIQEGGKAAEKEVKGRQQRSNNRASSTTSQLYINRIFLAKGGPLVRCVALEFIFRVLEGITRRLQWRRLVEKGKEVREQKQNGIVVLNFFISFAS